MSLDNKIQDVKQTQNSKSTINKIKKITTSRGKLFEGDIFCKINFKLHFLSFFGQTLFDKGIVYSKLIFKRKDSIFILFK